MSSIDDAKLRAGPAPERIRSSIFRHRGALMSIASATIMLASAQMTAAASATREVVPQPAVWARFDLLVKLERLPKRYSCIDLWYRFRDVLISIGARPEEILAYRCEESLGPRARSPQVHIRFSLPQLVSPSEHGTVDLWVVPRSVKLQPGTPPSIVASDCNLLRQLEAALLPALPLKVVAYRLACAAPHGRPPFEISISALALAPKPSTALVIAEPSAAPDPNRTRR